MEDDLQNLQALRAINRDNLENSPSTSAPGAIFHVEIYLDPATQKPIVLWGDILLAFEDAVHVRHNSRVVPFLKGGHYNPSGRCCKRQREQRHGRHAKGHVDENSPSNTPARRNDVVPNYHRQ
ncbi:MAG: hypothetical protein J3R72DRAFT_423859 [Linnemannia gamsii]|nr:MAG: hypothetical protein J3R72DRAFT_423859 [Linnemannia gamsii]